MLKYRRTGFPVKSDNETVPPFADFKANTGARSPTAIGLVPGVDMVS